MERERCCSYLAQWPESVVSVVGCGRITIIAVSTVRVVVVLLSLLLVLLGLWSEDSRALCLEDT